VAARAQLPRAIGVRPTGITHLTMLRQLNTRIVWSVVLLEGCFVLGAVPYAGAALKHAFGLDYLTIGLVLAGFGIGGIFYSLTVRWLIATLGELGMIATGGVLITASYLLLAFSPLWQLYVPALALIGCGFFCMHGTLQIRGTELAPQARGTAMSGFSFCLFVGQGLGVFLLSLAVDGPGYVVAFAIAALAVAVIAAALYALVATRTLRH
jgi:predicted MFS family arabinose efflux permease